MKSMIFILALLLSAMVFAKGPDAPTVTPYTSPDMVTLKPEVDVAQFKLVVAGPDGFVHEETFDGAHVPFFEIYNLSGEVLGDGYYNFELTGTPQLDKAVKAAMAAARATGDYSMIEAMRAQGQIAEGFIYAGGFLIHNGSVVMPEEVGPELIYEANTGRDEGTLPGNPIVTPEVTNEDTGKDSDDPDRDILQQDDVIITFSLCVGQDCVNGESFGFDTIRLKENNLRIKFQDTSTTASFPSNDWQLTANDSGNGGRNKFSIDDVTSGRTPFTVEAGAPANALYVDSTGDVGLGTSAPVVDLQIVSGNTPTLRLEQNGSAGFTPQTFDVASNEANFFVRDVTNGSKLSFRIEPGAPQDSLFVEGGGDIGIGTPAPSSSLHIRRTTGTAKLYVQEASGTPADRNMLELENNGGIEISLNDISTSDIWRINKPGDANKLVFSSAGSPTFMEFDSDGDLRIEDNETPSIYLKSNSGTQANRTMLTLENNGGAGLALRNNAANNNSGNIWNIIAQGNQSLTFNNNANPDTEVLFSGTGAVTGLSFTPSSDVNLKENFEEVSAHDILQGVLNLDITQWNFISEGEDVRHLGPMAQDFYAAFGLGGTETGISTTDANGVAFASIQALHQLFSNQQAAIAERDARIQTLETRVAEMDALKKRLAEIEAKLLED